MMTSLNDYQKAAMEFRLPTADEAYALLGLTGEVGELNSLLAKSIRDGVQRNLQFQDNVIKELGDILWFVAAIAKDLNVSLETIAVENLMKLQGRADRKTIQGNGDNR
jgi:NTP pyrophosphatase (non-canonical NTP hydrolase)